MRDNKAFLFGMIILGILLISSSIILTGCAKKEKVYHVGILSGSDIHRAIAGSFKDELTKLGYVEGKDIVYDLENTTFSPDKEEPILKNFVDDKVDLILAYNTEQAIAAKAAAQGTGIPVIFANTFIEGNDLVKSLLEPGGNITGVRYPGPDVAVKRLEVMHELSPQARRIWIPYQKGYPSAPVQLDAIRPVASSLNLTIIEFPSDNLADLESELENRSNSRSGDIGFDAVLFIADALSGNKNSFDIIANYTRPLKIPVGGAFLTTQDYGTVFAVTVDSAEEGKQAAYLADKIFKGTNAGTIPVVSAEPILIINVKVAQELGINVSEDLLAQANNIIH